ncbi:MAG: MBL fold metallo-hydrolase [Chloroflexi bacterium]|jgi:hydroxyacylglutathione hydrolase|nr:MBL fold metallo-hydrolase [Chloroflexota bacterium]MBT7080408.1 MBL fold metallo-hydrolase [Chloroflexota bacterium]MBT7289239.1 MBL fold metallo-hydrolase [Chloroflexota bacterium]
MIIETIVLGPTRSNCYIVGSEKTKEAMIIDPSAEARMVIDRAIEKGFEITAIVATHSHADHIGAISDIRDITGAAYIRHSTWRDPETTMRWAHLAGPAFKMPPPPDRTVEDGDTITIGDLSFQSVFTPGHCPDGLSLYGHGVVFCGDTLFNMGIARYDFTDSVKEDLLNSLKGKLMTLPDETIVLSGHGPQTTIGYERKHNPFLLSY